MYVLRAMSHLFFILKCLLLLCTCLWCGGCLWQGKHVRGQVYGRVLSFHPYVGPGAKLRGLYGKWFTLWAVSLTLTHFKKISDIFVLICVIDVLRYTSVNIKLANQKKCGNASITHTLPFSPPYSAAHWVHPNCHRCWVAELSTIASRGPMLTEF